MATPSFSAIVLKGAPLHPIIPKFYNFYLNPLSRTFTSSLLFLLAFVKAPAPQWGLCDSPALPYNMERLHIPVWGFQDHTGLTGIYHLYLHDGRQHPLMRKVQASEACRQELKPWSSQSSLNSSCFSTSFISTYSPLLALLSLWNKTTPTPLPAQDISGTSEDPGQSWIWRSCQALPDPVLFNPASLNVKGKKQSCPNTYLNSLWIVLLSYLSPV